MIAYGTAAQAQARRRATVMPDGGRTHKAEWMDTGTDRTFAPTTYLVEQPPHYSVNSHFHRQNEYQVVVHGSGMLGRHPVRAVTVHYAGAYSGYGPVVAGPEGLHYFTLRTAFDPGPVYLDEHREHMIRGPKRQRHGRPFPPYNRAALRTLRTAEELEMFPLDDEGGRAMLLRTPPNAAVYGTDPAGTAGQFWMVLAGTLVHKGTTLDRWETLFLSDDESPLRADAGADGVEVLVMQMPRLADAYRPPMDPGTESR